MKIGMLSSIAWRTPPRSYGPWENIVSNRLSADRMVRDYMEVYKEIISLKKRNYSAKACGISGRNKSERNQIGKIY
ncbi:MAG: hypothetical protein JW770_08080 [Actinobacteria bacterium]|nr:hypothetical protein [Actinomycetota bacterium]